jgi:hypothetical protein
VPERSRATLTTKEQSPREGTGKNSGHRALAKNRVERANSSLAVNAPADRLAIAAQTNFYCQLPSLITTSLLSFHMLKLVALVVIALITSWILFGHRLVVNRTHSLPVGLYYWSDVPIKKGSIVLFQARVKAHHFSSWE